MLMLTKLQKFLFPSRLSQWVQLKPSTYQPCCKPSNTLQASLDFAAVVALTTERPKFTCGLTPVKPMDLDHQWSQRTLSRSSQFMAWRGSAEKKALPSHCLKGLNGQLPEHHYIPEGKGMKHKNLPTLGNSTNVILLLNSKLRRQLPVHSTMLASIR